mmetsp:Transcript_22674/g.42708  ORF Transcript_22674/g.42708 Transcript_22674/m.42708 type:complete len:231 (+) Transcript_22674:63-755(+)
MFGLVAYGLLVSLLGLPEAVRQDLEGDRCLCKVVPEDECQSHNDIYHEGVPNEQGQLTDSQCCEITFVKKYFTTRKAAPPELCTRPKDGTCCCSAESLAGPASKCIGVYYLPRSETVDVETEEENDFALPRPQAWFPGAGVHGEIPATDSDSLWRISDYQGGSGCLKTVHRRVGGETKEFCHTRRIRLDCPVGTLRYNRIATGKPLKGWAHGCGHGMKSNHSDGRCLCQK